MNSVTQRFSRLRKQTPYFSKSPARSLHSKPANNPRILLCRILELLHTAADKTGVSSGKSVGRDDRLWHIKSRFLPKAVSQSLRIQLTLNSDTDCRFQIRKHSIGVQGGFAQKKPLPYQKPRAKAYEFSLR